MKQSEADSINEIPESATQRAGVALPTTKYNEFAKRHGFEDHASLMNHVGSNAIVAHQIVEELLGIIYQEDAEILDAQGSGTERYTDHWDTGFAGENDPYGIGSEYITQSPSPDAAKFTLPTQEEADAVHGTPTDPAVHGEPAEPLV